jgi:hypothetical protein
MSQIVILVVTYSIFAILSAIEASFQFIPKILTDSKLKQHPEVLNLSISLLAQSKYVYICSPTSSPETNHIQLYHVSLPPTGTALSSTKFIRVLTAKKISGLELTRYIKDLIYCMYIIGSTKYEFEVESLNFFRFVIIGVVTDLQSIISNLISIT